MVCGLSGAGKSTFINTLCDGDVYPEDKDGELPTTMDITTRSVGMLNLNFWKNHLLISQT